jgi:hypothetical protein
MFQKKRLRKKLKKSIDKIDLSLQSKYTVLKGRFLENVVQVTIMKNLA